MHVSCVQLGWYNSFRGHPLTGIKEHKWIRTCIKRKKGEVSLNFDQFSNLTCGTAEIVLMWAAQVVSAAQGNVCGSIAWAGWSVDKWEGPKLLEMHVKTFEY